jgi:hypothetical protein
MEDGPRKRQRLSTKSSTKKPTPATAPESPQAENEESVNLPIQKIAFKLYNACFEKNGLDGIYTVPQLAALGLTKDGAELAQVCQQLIENKLFIPLSKRGGGVLQYQLEDKEYALT